MTHSPVTFSDHVRHRTHHLLQPVARLCVNRGIHPDSITVFGTLLVGLAALFIATDMLLWGGVLVLLALPLDALDGAVARQRNATPRQFGAFLDSTSDRYADGMLFGALAFLGAQRNDDLVLLLALLTMVGAYLVSYTRARADGLGIECKVGLFTRLERTVVLLLLLLSGWLTIWLMVLAIGTHFTALQRIWHVRQAMLL